MKMKSIGAFLVAALPCMGFAQSNVTLQLSGPPSSTGLWGSALPFQATVAGNCGGTVSASLVTSLLPTGAGPWVSGSFPGSIACTSGAFSATAPLQLNWYYLPADWQTFQSTATLAPAAAVATSKFQSLRFDPEFQVRFQGNSVYATLATAAPGFSSCTGRRFEINDRENTNVPPPPPNIRTPYEMFSVTSAACDNGLPQLLNLQLPTRYDEIWVYDKFFGIMSWRNATPAPCVPPSCPLAPPPPGLINARVFERSANIPLYGDGAGVRSVVAGVLYQPDLRGAPLQDMWWAGPAESGWGLNIAKSGDKLFVSGFIYDDAGKPTWVVMSNGQWDDLHNVWYGDFYTPTGSRFGAYNANLFVIGSPVGTGSLSFTDANNGHFDYTLHGASGGKTISRYVFAPTSETPAKYTGIYWGGFEENGWGVTVSQQGNAGFATWYTYDGEDRALWFFMPAGKFTAANTVSGPLYRTTGGPWAGKHYDGQATQVIPVGTLELKFSDTDKPGTMTAVVDGVTIVNPLYRFGF